MREYLLFIVRYITQTNSGCGHCQTDIAVAFQTFGRCHIERQDILLRQRDAGCFK